MEITKEIIKNVKAGNHLYIQFQLLNIVVDREYELQPEEFARIVWNENTGTYQVQVKEDGEYDTAYFGYNEPCQCCSLRDLIKNKRR
jgi:hypothetical protein